MKIRSILLIVLTLGVANSNAGVMPIPGSERIDELYARAAIVVKGRVTSVRVENTSQESSGQLRLSKFQATIQVDRVYKGPVNSRVIEIFYTAPANPEICSVSPCVRFIEGMYQLLFLSQAGDEIVLLNEFQSRFNVSARLSPDVVPRDSQWDMLRKDLVAGIEDDDSIKVITSARLLSSINDPLVIPLLHKLTSAERPEVRGWAILGLLRLRDFSILPACQEYLELSVSAEARLPQLQIASQIEMIRSPEAAASLRTMASSGSSLARTSAIVALRQIRDIRNVPVFAAALNDSSWRTRHSAVMGLCDFENAGKGCNTDLKSFRVAEGEYIRSWKEWWEAQGHLKYQ